MNEHSTVYKIGNYVYKASPRLFYKMKGTYAKRRNEKIFKPRNPSVPGKLGSVSVEMTIVCNLRCNFCWWWGENGTAFNLVKTRDPIVTQELNTQEIFKIVDEVAAKYPGADFYLAGGEPFLRKDCLDIIRYINDKGLPVATTTNGTLIKEETFRELAKMKNLMVTFSLDGTKEVHDKIRGSGVYDKVIHSIKTLAEYKGKNMFPIIKTNTTFSPWLMGHEKELVHELEELNLSSIFFQHLWFTDKAKADAQREMLKEIFGTEEKGAEAHIISAPTHIYAKQLADEIKELERTRFKTPIFIRPQMTYEDIIKYYTDLNFSVRKRCVAPWTGVQIKANGDVIFCPDEWITQYKIGNVRNNSLEEIWNNEKAKMFRDAIHKYELFPACARCCAVNG